MSNPAPFNPQDPAFHDNPYPIFHAYRDRGPLQLGLPIQPGDPSTVWHVFGHREVSQLLKDPRMTRGALMGNRPEFPPGAMSILMMDPPDHGRIRRLVSRPFTPRAVQRLQPLVDALTEEVLAETDDRDQIELVADVAFPLPVSVISALLGLPLEDRPAVRRWSHTVTAALDVVKDRATFEAAAAAAAEFRDYLRAAIRERRRRPQDDLLTELLAAEEDGERLTEDELVSLVALLVAAGHETTVNLITNGLWALVHDEAARHRVQREGLTLTGVEELLRFDSPIQVVGRVASTDVVLGDRIVSAGANVSLWVGAANRDPSVFHDPDRLQLDREPNPHLSFGGGIHSCLGAPLAVMEGHAALSALFRRHPDLEVVEASAKWREGTAFRGLDAITVTW